jgi:tetrahydromethanopterin S-methyltransferase subunit G
MSSTEIEKKNLEAHVELCAERYEALDHKLTNLDNRLTKVEEHVIAIRDNITQKTGGINKQTITMLSGVAGILLTTILGLLLHLATK